MKTEIKVPAMGESISEATVGTILKPSGSTVKMDDELLELETDKVNQVLYAPQAGVVMLNVQSGDAVKIGQVIGSIDTDAAAKPIEKTPEKRPEKPEMPKPLVPKTVQSGARIPKEELIQEKRVAEEPVKEKRVAEPVVVQTAVPGGRKETRTKMSKIRQVIAKRLVYLV